MEVIAITGNARAGVGKKASKAIRKESQVPCVIYGGEENIHFSAIAKEFKKLVYTADFKLADITVEGKTYKCILKDLQTHPVTDEILHMDFIQLTPNKKIKVELPVRFVGVSPGVKGGGTLVAKLRRLKVITTPEALVEDLSVDISELELGFSIRVRDVQVPDGVEITNDASIPVASVEVPRALKSADAEAEGAEAEGTEAAAEGAEAPAAE